MSGQNLAAHGAGTQASARTLRRAARPNSSRARQRPSRRRNQDAPRPHAANLSPEVADPICRLPLPTFIYSTRGCLPWRPAAEMGTRWKAWLVRTYNGGCRGRASERPNDAAAPTSSGRPLFTAGGCCADAAIHERDLQEQHSAVRPRSLSDQLKSTRSLVFSMNLRHTGPQQEKTTLAACAPPVRSPALRVASAPACLPGAGMLARFSFGCAGLTCKFARMSSPGYPPPTLLIAPPRQPPLLITQRPPSDTTHSSSTPVQKKPCSSSVFKVRHLNICYYHQDLH